MDHLGTKAVKVRDDWLRGILSKGLTGRVVG